MTRYEADQAVASLMNAAKRREWRGRTIGNGYTHAVQVLMPISFLQQIDMLLRKNSSLTRATIIRRALTPTLTPS